jgi:hypothetical protein
VEPTPQAGWKPLGSTGNSHYFLGPAEDVVLVLPDPGSRDDGSSALENVAFQAGYARRLGRRCATVVMLGRLVSQDAGARRVYAAGMDPGQFFATALVVSNGISRAIGSFFLGLARPRIPIRMFDSIEKALAWVEEQRPAAGKP